MVDQAEIHRKAVSNKDKERIEAARQLLSDFAILHDKARIGGYRMKIRYVK